MTTSLTTRPAPTPAKPAADPEHPHHRHTRACWWDVTRARWVCD